MDHIYCIVGPSGSGKTTVAKKLESDGYNVIKSYTTRPPRSPNEWGHTFVERYPYEQLPHVIAYNQFSKYEYWATEEQFKGKGKSIYIIDPHGDEQLRRTVDNVTTIYLALSRNQCYGRMVKESRGYEQSMARLNHDREVFAKVKTDWVVNADQKEDEVYNQVKAIIEGG